VQVLIPEGTYEIRYDFHDSTAVARHRFTVVGGRTIRISPALLEKPNGVDAALFKIYIDILTHAVEGL
jgi:hypothetical protein